MFSRLLPKLSFRLVIAMLLAGAVHGQTFHAYFGHALLGASAVGTSSGASSITEFASIDALFQLLSLSALAIALLKTGDSARNGWWIGFIFAFAWFLNGAGWVYISMHQYGGMPAPLAGAAAALFALYLALFTGLTCLLVNSQAFLELRFKANGLAFVAQFAGAMTLGELARGYFMTGFPWAAIGYAHVDSPLSTAAPYVGVYGLSFLAAAIAASFAYGVAANQNQSRRTKRWPLCIVLIALTIALPKIAHRNFTTPSGTFDATLIQPNIEQSMKFRPEKSSENFSIITNAIRRAKAPLVILPETVWPRVFEATSESVYQALADQINNKKTIILGVPIIERKNAGPHGLLVSNSAVIINKLDDIGSATDPTIRNAYRYDKHHLVPFGEFIPLGFSWFVELMNMPLGNFNRGSLQQPPFIYKDGLQTIRLGLNICYEDLFGEEIAGRAHDADVLINVSNLAWFGQSKAIAQHLEIARMRALETQRPMLRATNTGATVHINAHGKVEQHLAQDQLGVLEVKVTARNGVTPYMSYGNWPVVLLAFGLVILMLILRPLANGPSRGVGARPKG